jgi:hypothetical protein
MKIRSGSGFFLVVVATGLFALTRRVNAQLSFGVTGPSSSFYQFNNSSNNPTLTLQRGVTYQFQVSALGHPFFVKTVPNSTGTANAYTTNVTGNGVQNGTLTFAVPTNAPNRLYYHCSAHNGMGGILDIVSPPTPPTVRIVSILVSPSNIVVRSTGATNWSAIPEFRSNLTFSAWTQVSSFSNSFANNTNTTTFARLDAICGSNVFIRVRNKLN